MAGSQYKAAFFLITVPESGVYSEEEKGSACSLAKNNTEEPAVAEEAALEEELLGNNRLYFIMDLNHLTMGLFYQLCLDHSTEALQKGLLSQGHMSRG